MSLESLQTSRNQRQLKPRYLSSLLPYLLSLLAQLSLGCDSQPRQISTVMSQKASEKVNHTSLAKWQDSLKDMPVTVIPNQDIDEREILFFHYNNLRSGISLQSADNAVKLNNLNALRDRVNLCREYLRDKKSDPRMLSLFTDLSAFIDACCDYVIKLNQIDRHLSNRAHQEAAETSFNSGKLGGQAAIQMYMEGATGKQSTLAGLVVAAGSYYFESLRNQNELDESRNNAIELATEEFNRKTSALSAREQNTFDWLASQFHWRKSEQGKYVDRYTKLGEDIANRFSAIKTIDDSLAVSRDLQEAARLVPVSTIYDEYRGLALQFAARTETWAAERYLKGKRWGSHSSPIILHALRLHEAAMQFDPKDESGRSRSDHAWALGIAGRFNEAVKKANQVFSKRNTSPSFLYNYVRLCCCAGVVDAQTLKNLRIVLAHGVFADDLDYDNKIDLNKIRKDIHLEPLRTKLRDEYADLMRVKFTWYIQYGLLNNDLVMVNQSAFPLTNIQLKLRIEANGSAWEPVNTLGSLSAGQTYSWKKFDSTLSKSKVTKSVATLTCDQAK